jgi:hypothetical protein
MKGVASFSPPRSLPKVFSNFEKSFLLFQLNEHSVPEVLLKELGQN